MSCEGPIPSIHIGKAIADKWVKNYQTIKREALASTAGSQGDTKTIWYSVDQLRELIDEADCQGATGVRIYFAAYSATPNLPGEALHTPAGANKGLTVVFVLTKQNPGTGAQQDFFIEDQPGFDQRESAGGEGGEGDFDTGNPSPPAPGDGELLPLP
jgi:hypothetical protein